MIHQFINNGYHIILDVNSGSVHVVDPVVYDAVEVVSGLVPEMESLSPFQPKSNQMYLTACGADIHLRNWGRRWRISRS